MAGALEVDLELGVHPSPEQSAVQLLQALKKRRRLRKRRHPKIADAAIPSGDSTLPSPSPLEELLQALKKRRRLRKRRHPKIADAAIPSGDSTLPSPSPLEELELALRMIKEVSDRIPSEDLTLPSPSPQVSPKFLPTTEQAHSPHLSRENRESGRHEKTQEDATWSLRHGKFLVDGAVKHFVYVPPSTAHDLAGRSPEIFGAILRHWNLPKPHLLIKFSTGFAHPRRFMDENELIKMENDGGSSEVYKYYLHFREFAAAQSSRNVPADYPSGDLPTIEENEQVRQKKVAHEALKLLNDFLYRSVSNLLDIIVRACVRNRCWILVEGVSAGGQLLLQQVAERCDEQPVILVVDCFNKSRYGYKSVCDFIQSDLELREEFGADTLGELVKGREDVDLRTSVVEIAARLASRATPDSDSQHEQTRVKAAIMTARMLEHAKPLNQPITKPLKLDDRFWDKHLEEKGWTCKSHREPDVRKIPFYHWHFRGGTHYIFSMEPTDVLNLHCLAPSGCIFLGGGMNSKQELMARLANGYPVICVNHTGRITQDFARCHELICSQLYEASRTPKGKGKPQLSRSVEGLSEEADDQHTTQPVDYFLDKVGRSSLFESLMQKRNRGMELRAEVVARMVSSMGSCDFSPPEICELFLTYVRRGLQIMKLCVVLDPLNPADTSGGQTEDKLSLCLSNFAIVASNDTSNFADVGAVKAGFDF